MPADRSPSRRGRFGSRRPGGGDGSPRERDPEPDLPLEDRAREFCLAALERRMRTRKDLAQLLARKRIPADVAEAVLDRLEDVGLVNDEAYARALVASRQRTKPRGGRGLSAELVAKGVPRAVIDRILEETEESENPVDAARRAVAPKLRTLAGKPPEEIRRKAEQFLLRRGFSYEVAREVLREAKPDDEVND